LDQIQKKRTTNLNMGKAEQHFEERTEAGLGSPHPEASKMLEAALQQMDGIISGGKWETLVHLVHLNA
jgi:hypothetical protein